MDNTVLALEQSLTRVSTHGTKQVPVSIIVCTHERPDDLKRCLAALTPIAKQGHEVIIVDNAPRSNRTALLVAETPFRYVCEPQPGLDQARNAGLRAASHALVAFTDDDATPHVRWADAIARPFIDARIGCVTGLVLALELETAAQRQFEVYCLHRRVFAARIFSTVTTAPAEAGVCGMGANMAMRRELALKLGGFDPRLDAGTLTHSGGDTDMFARILEHGEQICYTPEALVWHRHRRSDAELQECVYGYGVGLYAFLTKRIIERQDWHAAIVGIRWFWGPILKAGLRALSGRPTVGLRLLLHEARGALQGPEAYFQARANKLV